MSYGTRFWALIDLGRRNPDELERTIAAMSESELVQFHWCFEERTAGLKDEEFIVHLGFPRSEDYIDDVAQWIVGRGLRHYEEVMMVPSKIADELPIDVVPPPWPGIVVRVYRQRYGIPFRFLDELPPVEPS